MRVTERLSHSQATRAQQATEMLVLIILHFAACSSGRCTSSCYEAHRVYSPLDGACSGALFDARAYLEFTCSFLHTFSILAINYIYQSVCVVEVMPPEGPQLFLAPNIPDGEQNILVLDLLDIESCVS